MPNSLRCKIKHLCHNGTLTERERDRILKALEQESCEDKRLYIKVFADLEPDDIAEKIYQICDEDKFPKVIESLKEYFDYEPCEDCISREDAIKQCGFGMTSLLIAGCLKRLPSVTPTQWHKVEDKLIDKDSYSRGFDSGYDAGKYIAQSKWHKVEDGLPKEDGRYLCVYRMSESGTCIDFGRVVNGEWYVGGVIAWMELPVWKEENK